jgi:hypothetical protein
MLRDKLFKTRSTVLGELVGQCRHFELAVGDSIVRRMRVEYTMCRVGT